MELPKRKPLRLKEFSYSNGGSYFLTLCVLERKKILSKIEPLFGCKFIDELPRDVFPFDGDDRYLRVIPTDIGKITEKYILSSEKIKGVSIDDYVITVEGEEIVPVAAGNNWCVEIKNISAADLDTLYTMVVTRKADNAVTTIKYSALNYVNMAIKYMGDDVNLVNAVKALYLYNDAANTYFGR